MFLRNINFCRAMLYIARPMLSQDVSPSLRPSVCLYYTERPKHIVKLFYYSNFSYQTVRKITPTGTPSVV